MDLQIEPDAVALGARHADHHRDLLGLLFIGQHLVAMVGLTKRDVGFAGATVALAARVEHPAPRRLNRVEDRLVGIHDDLGAVIEDDGEGLILHGA